MIKIVNRLASMFLDHLVMTFVLVPLLIGVLVVLQLLLGDSYPDLVGENVMVGYMIFMMIFNIYFLKDSYRGKSIGKRVIGLQVVNRNTNKPASSLQCFIRNLLIPIWPLEVLISLFSTSIRLGDLIANTRVIEAEKENVKTIFSDIKQTRFSFNSILILIIGLVYSYGLSHLFASLIY